MSNVTSTWELTPKEKKRLGAIVNKNRTTWPQLANYYKTPPSKLMSRIEALAMKLKDATELADQYDGADLDELSDGDRETVLMAGRYRLIWQDAVAETYTALVADSTDIYGDD